MLVGGRTQADAREERFGSAYSVHMRGRVYGGRGGGGHAVDWEVLYTGFSKMCAGRSLSCTVAVYLIWGPLLPLFVSVVRCSQPISWGDPYINAM